VLKVSLAPAGLASGSGAARQPGVSARPTAGSASGTGSAWAATITTSDQPTDLGPVHLTPEDWAVRARAEQWTVLTRVERWAVSAVVEEDAMHVGDTAFPLRIRASFADPASGDLGTVLANPGITYTVTMEQIGADHDTDTPVLEDEPMTVFANDGTTITLDRTWLAGETATAGRYSLVVVAHVGPDQFTLPSDGRRAELLIEP
jgi:hypothetical protein